jgi:hypothetical protein
MTRAITRVLLLAASISIAAPRPLEAQLGGLIKKKVKEAVAKPEPPAKTGESQPAASKSAEKTSNGPIGFGSAVVEITDSSFNDFMRGIQKEADAQAIVKKEIARYGTHADYEACKIRVAESPEGKKTMDRMYNPPKDIKAEDFIKLQSKVVEDMDSLTRKGCPLDPSYWSPGRVSQSLDSVHKEVAQSISAEDTEGQLFSVALERIERLCRYKGFGPDNTAAKPEASNGTPVKFAGEGKDIFWLYTENEVNVINAANCKRYYALIAKLIK